MNVKLQPTYQCYRPEGAGHVVFEIARRGTEFTRKDNALPLRTGLGERITEFLLKTDSRYAAQIRSGRTVSIRVRLSGNGLAAAPRQRTVIAALIRPMLEPIPDLGHLFPFQADGVKWLTGRRAGLLADEMGLGKTIQAISALRLLVAEGEASSNLVVCPKSLIANWIVEFAKWAPELVVRAIEGPTTPPVLEQMLLTTHVIVSNYERVSTFEGLQLDVLVADEAHRVRNVGASISQSVRSLRAGRRWAITGTPIERDIEDFATILSFLAPNRFAADDAKSATSTLRTRAAPYVLRRTRSAVLDNLPSVIEHQECLTLYPKQRAAYDDLLRTDEGPNTDYIALIGQLRQLCDYEPKSCQSVKIDRTVELLEDIAALSEKALVFSYLIEPLKLLGVALDEAGLESAHRFFDGSLDIGTRRRVLDEFRNDIKVRFLLASTRATSEGLTLTEANHVIFINLWWNPSANQQARDRVVRIGQKRVVHVYSFICTQTIEENLQKILVRKDNTYREVVDRLANPNSAAPEDENVARHLVLGNGGI